MDFFILAAAALILAAVLWYSQALGGTEDPPPPPPELSMDQRLRQLLTEDPRLIDALTEAIRALEAVMAHPELGGPGFLLVQFPSAAADGRALVTAQYPNIREGLYRRIVRQELDDLAGAGMPGELLALDPAFETESGGVVLVSVQAGGVPQELADSFRDRRERNAALDILAELLEERVPAFSVRIFGTDLLLSPVREQTATSIDG